MTLSLRAQVVTRRTYNRPLDEDGKVFETWEQTVDRVIRHQRWLWERALGRELNVIEDAELAELRQLMLERKVLTSGRTLWLGGTDVAKRREASQFNCAFTHVETVYDVVDVLWLLLQGCGVGFRPVVGQLTGFVRPIPKLTIIRSQRTVEEFKNGNRGREHNIEHFDPQTRRWYISVGDSAEAWAKSIGKLLAGKYPANELVLDFSEIRPAGIRLRGYGWISSGDTAIARAYEAIFGILNRRAGCLLSRIDILDLINWLGTVLSSRRSAEIALVAYGEDEWEEFTVAKREYWINNPQRGQSNNSLLFLQKPTRDELERIFKMMIESGGSEPGFINQAAATRRAPWFKGVNPCLAGDTLVPVQGQGLVFIAELADKVVPVVDGNGNVVMAKAEKTGENQPLLLVRLSDGSEYKVTPWHEFVMVDGSKRQAKDLQPGDELMPPKGVEGAFGSIHDPDKAYVDAWLIADGTWHNEAHWAKLYLYPPKHKYKEALEKASGRQFTGTDAQNRYVMVFTGERYAPPKDRVPDYVLRGDKETVLAFIRGYLEADGYVRKSKTNGWIVQVVSVHKTFLQQLQSLLALLGVHSSIAKLRDGGKHPMPDGNGVYKEYNTRTTYRLVVSNPTKLVAMLGWDTPARGGYNVQKKVRVVAVEDTGERADVFCFGVPTTQSFDLPTCHSGNCAEILLGNKAFCNLVEVDVGKFKGDSAGLQRAVEIAARACYRQTCVDLRDGILQEAWHLNNAFLRLLGVGLTGIVRRPDLSAYDYAQLQRAAVAGGYSMADELGLPRPKNVTTVKPSGTLSKIMDTTEGVHKPLGKYIFNNIVFSRHDPLVAKCREAGYRVFDNPNDPDSVLVTFPVKWDGVEFDEVDGKEVNLESAVDQLERYKMLMQNWCQQNVSCTVSYSPEEVPAIIDWLLENWDNYVGVSFLLRADPTKTAKDLGYLYLPQEVVTKEAYEQYVSQLKPLVLDDDTNSFEELRDNECTGGACPIR